MIDTNPQKIKEVLTRGVEKIYPNYQALETVLKSGKKLRIKHGIDPTGPKIHLGRAIQFWKLRAFQELGHQVVLIIGDFTAQIGDASDKQAMRKPLSEKEVKENMKGYAEQIAKILDMKKAELRYNSEWLNKLSAKDLLSLSMKFTAQQMIQRRNFKERWEQGKPIGLHELDYPLFQGYDSVAIKADVEIGGTDQLFNLQAGRVIQKMFKQKPQDIITLKMLPGLDARKMSTSWGNIITIIDTPQDMFGKIMSMKDELMSEYFELCTQLPLEEIEKIKKELKNEKTNPRDLKARLAREIVALYYNKKAAENAEKEFNQVFKDKELPSEMPTIKIADNRIKISDTVTDLTFNLGLADSKSDAKRLIIQKAVEIDGEIQTDWKAKPKIKKGSVIRVGKRKFIKIKE